jgi:hypothetical protein
VKRTVYAPDESNIIPQSNAGPGGTRPDLLVLRVGCPLSKPSSMQSITESHSVGARILQDSRVVGNSGSARAGLTNLQTTACVRARPNIAPVDPGREPSLTMTCGSPGMCSVARAVPCIASNTSSSSGSCVPPTSHNNNPLASWAPDAQRLGRYRASWGGRAA